MGSFISKILALLVLLMPRPALACAVCGFGEDGSREAYILTTGILTLVPLALIGTGVYYLARLAKRREQEQRETNGGAAPLSATDPV